MEGVLLLAAKPVLAAEKATPSVSDATAQVLPFLMFTLRGPSSCLWWWTTPGRLLDGSCGFELR